MNESVAASLPFVVGAGIFASYGIALVAIALDLDSISSLHFFASICGSTCHEPVGPHHLNFLGSQDVTEPRREVPPPVGTRLLISHFQHNKRHNNKKAAQQTNKQTQTLIETAQEQCHGSQPPRTPPPPAPRRRTQPTAMLPNHRSTSPSG